MKHVPCVYVSVCNPNPIPAPGAACGCCFFSGYVQFLLPKVVVCDQYGFVRDEAYVAKEREFSRQVSVQGLCVCICAGVHMATNARGRCRTGQWWLYVGLSRMMLLLCAALVTLLLQSEAVSLAWVQFLKKLSPKGDTMEGTRGLRRDAHGALV